MVHPTQLFLDLLKGSGISCRRSNSDP